MKTYICSLLIVIPYLARAEMVELEQFFIDKTEVSVGQFELYAKAESILTAAERDGGGLVYEFGWTQKPGCMQRRNLF